MGFRFSKKIVLYDLLVKQLHRKEILAILGHEIGHHKSYRKWPLSHFPLHQMLGCPNTWLVICVDTYKSLAMQLFGLGAFIFHFSRVVNMPEFYQCFGFEEVDVCLPTLFSPSFCNRLTSTLLRLVLGYYCLLIYILPLPILPIGSRMLSTESMYSNSLSLSLSLSLSAISFFRFPSLFFSSHTFLVLYLPSGMNTQLIFMQLQMDSRSSKAHWSRCMPTT